MVCKKMNLFKCEAITIMYAYCLQIYLADQNCRFKMCSIVFVRARNLNVQISLLCVNNIYQLRKTDVFQNQMTLIICSSTKVFEYRDAEEEIRCVFDDN